MEYGDTAAAAPFLCHTAWWSKSNLICTKSQQADGAGWIDCVATYAYIQKLISWVKKHNLPVFVQLTFSALNTTSSTTAG